jgi:hypothetical protein
VGRSAAQARVSAHSSRAAFSHVQNTKPPNRSDFDFVELSYATNVALAHQLRETRKIPLLARLVLFLLEYLENNRVATLLVAVRIDDRSFGGQYGIR